MSEESNRPPKKELSMEMRLLLAFVLMGGVLFTTPYFYKSIAPPPPAKTPATMTPPPTAKTPAPPSEAVVTAPSAAPAAEPIAGQAEETAIIDTALYHITFSNRGAVVKSWTLKHYKDSAGKPLELINQAGAPKTGYPFALTFKNQKPSVDLSNVLYAVKRDGMNLAFEYSSGRTTARKSFTFAPNSYLSQVSTEVTENGVALPHLITWRGGFGDFAVTTASGMQHTIYYDVNAGKLVVNEAKVASDGPVTAVGNYSFAGLEDLYFTAVFLPAGTGATEVQTFSDTVVTQFNKEEAPFAGAAVGGEGRNRFSLFVGPKDLDILTKVNPRLEQVVDFGFFGFLAKPLFLIVRWMNDTYIHNYGWTIIVVTILINFALFPLKLSSLKSMKKMQVLQPQIAAIQEKYKKLSMKDPKRQEQNQEMMSLYSKHGVNPVGGCVPLLLQMPFLFAFYTVFTVAIEMRGASWLWVSDLSQPENLAIRLLPITMIITQLIMQKMTPVTGGDPMQQKVMQIMPVVFGFMFYGAASGLMLYWLTGNLVAIGQQWFFNKTSIASVAAESLQVKKKNDRK